MAFPTGIADFRSDTVTRPTDEMRKAMAAADVGDDVYAEDPTVNALEEEAAAAVGKQAALFVPTGTMSNQLALGVLTRPGVEVLCVERSHVKDSEAGAAGALWGVQFQTVEGSRGGDITADQIAPLLGARASHMPRSGLLAWENTHNASGGRVVSLDVMRDTSSLAGKDGWSVHLDGARIFNASVASGHPPALYAAVADTVNFCFSKGLGAPVGSVLCGSADIIQEARFLRRRLGGGMRQSGVVAAAARVALRSWERLEDDHALATQLAHAIHDRYGMAVDLDQVETNMVLVHDVGIPFRLADVPAAARLAGIEVAAPRQGHIRLVTHRDVDKADVDRLLSVFDGLVVTS